MISRRHFLWTALGSMGAACLPFARHQQAHAQDTDDLPSIVIEGAAFKPFAIALPEPQGDDGNAAIGLELIQIVRADLAMTGLFQVVDPARYTIADGFTPETLRREAWLSTGAAGVVKLHLQGGGNWQIDSYCYNLDGPRLISQKNYSGSKADLRSVAHQIADEIFRAFTGEPSVFRTKIAAVRRVGNEKHLVVMDMDGKNIQQITKDGRLNLLPTWHPAGSSLLFTSYRRDNPDLYEIGAQGGTPRLIANYPGLNIGGRYSPDASRIALTLSKDGNSEVYLIDREGKILRRLTDSWGIDTSPSWSVDGSQLAFVSSRAKTPQVYLMNNDGSGASRLTFQGSYNQQPVFNPRGSHIAFTTRNERGGFDIMLMNLSNRDITNITRGEGDNEDPTFAPNGRMLAFTSTRNGTRQIFISSLDGRVQTMIGDRSEYSTPSWGPFVR